MQKEPKQGCKGNDILFLTKKGLPEICLQSTLFEQRWGRSSVWLERLPVTQKAASSSLVAPAIDWTPLVASFFTYMEIK